MQKIETTVGKNHGFSGLLLPGNEGSDLLQGLYFASHGSVSSFFLGGLDKLSRGDGGGSRQDRIHPALAAKRQIAAIQFGDDAGEVREGQVGL